MKTVETIPSPTMTHFRGGRDAIDETAYPDLDGFFADLARVYREEIAGLAAYVLIEKLAPAGQRISRFAGIVLILWGLAVLVDWM